VAAPAARIQVEGAAELQRAMKRMGADLKDLTKVNRAASDIVAQDARGGAPRLTGALSKTIKPGARKTAGYVQAGSRLVPYAGPIHFGWPRRNIEPQPFLYDALDRRADEVIDKYRDHIGDLVRKLDRETPG
jgi:hypothetical protein